MTLKERNLRREKMDEKYGYLFTKEKNEERDEKYKYIVRNFFERYHEKNYDLYKIYFLSMQNIIDPRKWNPLSSNEFYNIYDEIIRIEKNKMKFLLDDILKNMI